MILDSSLLFWATLYNHAFSIRRKATADWAIFCVSCTYPVANRKRSDTVEKKTMLETAVDEAMKYGTCTGRDGVLRSSAAFRTSTEDSELLTKNTDSSDARRPARGCALATVVILTAVNLINYMDRYALAGKLINILTLMRIFTCRWKSLKVVVFSTF